MAWNFLIQAAIWVAGTVLTALLTKRTTSRLTPGEVQFPRAEADAAVPVVVGTYRIGLNVIHYAKLTLGDNRISTGSFAGFSTGSQRVGYFYYLDLQGLLCHGVVSAVSEIYVDGTKRLSEYVEKSATFSEGSLVVSDRTILAPDLPLATASGGTTETVLVIDAPKLLGGVESRGGLAGTLRIYSGYGGAQTANARLETLAGVELPAYPFLAHVVLEDAFYVGTSPQLPALEFVVTRLPTNPFTGPGSVTTDAGVVGANAALALYELLTNNDWGCGLPPHLFDTTTWDWAVQACDPSLAPTTTTIAAGHDFEDMDTTAAQKAAWDANTTVKGAPATWQFGSGGVGDGYHLLQSFTNTELPAAMSDGFHSGFTYEVPNGPYVVSIDAGTTGITQYGTVGYAWRATGTETYPEWSAIGSAGTYRNIAIVTGGTQTIEVRLTAEKDDLDRLSYFRDIYLDNVRLRPAGANDTPLGVSYVLDREQPARQVVDDLLRLMDAVLYLDPVTGLLAIRLLRDVDSFYFGYGTAADPAEERQPILSLTDAQVRSVEVEDATGDALVNEVKVRFVDAARDYKPNTARARNLAAIYELGRVESRTVEFLGVTNAALAQSLAERELRALATPRQRVRLVMDRVGYQLTPAQFFDLSWTFGDGTAWTNKVLRVQTVHETPFGQLEVEAVEHVFADSSVTAFGTVDAPPVTPGTGPAAPTMPSVEVQQDRTATDGTLRLLVTDPSDVVTEVAFATRVGAGAFGSFAADAAEPYDATVPLSSGGQSAIAYRVTYTDPAGDAQTITGVALYDALPLTTDGFPDALLDRTTGDLLVDRSSGSLLYDRS